MEQGESRRMRNAIGVDHSLVRVSFELSKDELIILEGARSLFQERSKSSASRTRSRIEENENVFYRSQEA